MFNKSWLAKLIKKSLYEASLTYDVRQRKSRQTLALSENLSLLGKDSPGPGQDSPTIANICWTSLSKGTSIKSFSWF